MSNSLFDWPSSVKRFVPFDSARADDINEALDHVSSAMDVIESTFRRSIKLPLSSIDQVLASNRAGKYLGFDADGNATLLQGYGSYRGIWQTGVEYAVGDLFRDNENNNTYVVKVAHTSTTIAADSAAGKTEILISTAGLTVQYAEFKTPSIATENKSIRRVNLSPFRSIWGSLYAGAEFQAYSDAALTNLVGSASVSAPATIAYINELQPSTTYYIRGRYRDDEMSYSNWSVAQVRTMLPAIAPSVQVQELTSSNMGANSLMGASVAMSSNGQILVVGAPGDTVGSFANAGTVEVYSLSGDLYAPAQTIVHSAGAASLLFGTSVAVSNDGNTIAIGGTGIPTGGRACVWFRSTTTWAQQAIVAGSDTTTGDFFGCSIALSGDGNTMAVGARSDANSGGTAAGSVYIFTRSGITWTQQARVQASDAAANDNFGHCISISSDGNVLAIGSPNDDIPSFTDAGSAYIFTRSGSTWTQTTKILPNTPAASGKFGSALSMSADGVVCAIGSNYTTTNSKVDVYRLTAGTWTYVDTLPNSEDSEAVVEYGSSVATSPDGAIVAMNYKTNTDVYVRNDAGAYVLSSKLSSGSTTVAASSAIAISSDNRILVVGNRLTDVPAADAGSVFVYR